MAVTLNASTTTGLVQSADTSGEINLQSNGTTKLSVLSTGVSGVITQGTAVASTSGTSIDFTSIPSWVKRVTVMFNGVSTNGTSLTQIQIGAGSVTTSGYAATSSFSSVSSNQYAYATTGFILDNVSTSGVTITRSGSIQILLIGSNTWIASGNISAGSVGQVTNACGGNSPALGGTLDRIRITTVNGTDTFDAGSINILYEG